MTAVEGAGTYRAYHRKLGELSQMMVVRKPDGGDLVLPVGSTMLEAAYLIHSGLGVNITGGMRNGVTVLPDAKLSKGDTIQILTHDVPKFTSGGRLLQWHLEQLDRIQRHLRIVRYPPVRKRIRMWLRNPFPKSVRRALQDQLALFIFQDTLISNGNGLSG